MPAHHDGRPRVGRHQGGQQTGERADGIGDGHEHSVGTVDGGVVGVDASRGQVHSSQEREACSVIEMGGGGPIPTRLEHRVNDTPCRGFWSYYAELMGFEPVGAER